jgi:exonuclease VII large subunit
LNLDKLDQLLFSLGPNATLDRGYAIVTKVGTTEIISDPDVISKGQSLDVLVAKGKFEVEVGKITSQE